MDWKRRSVMVVLAAVGVVLTWWLCRDDAMRGSAHEQPGVMAPVPGAEDAPGRAPDRPLGNERAAEPVTGETSAPARVAVADQLADEHASPAILVETVDGKPLASAELWLVPLDGSVPEDVEPAGLREASIVLTTDEIGAAAPPRDGRRYLVHLHHKGYSWVDEIWDPVHNRAVRLRASPSKQIGGRVVDRSRSPIPNAVVRRRRRAMGNELEPWRRLAVHAIEEEVGCDEKGRFAFEMVDDREQQVSGAAEGFVTATYRQIVPDAHVDILLSRPATVFGRLTDDQGHPLAGGEVLILISGMFPEAYAHASRTDATGFYEAHDAPSGQIAVGFHHDGFASDRIETSVEPGNRTEVSCRLQKATTIDGRVLGADHRPVPDVDIDVVDETLGVNVDRFFASGDGQFQITKVALGRPYLLYVGPTKTTTTHRFHGILGGSANVELMVDRLTLLSGSAHFDGEPTRQLTFRQIRRSHDTQDAIWEQTSDTGAVERDVNGGRYQPFKLSPGVSDVEIRAAGYAPLWLRDLSVSPIGGDLRMDLSFTKGLSLEVDVLDAETEAPIAGARVAELERCFTGNYVEGFGARSWTADDQGRVSMNPFAPDTPAISIVADGHGCALVTDPLGSAVGSPPVLEVRLHKGGSIAGRVEVPYALPETAVTLHAKPLGFENGLSSSVDHNGDYRIDNLPAGPVEVRLEDLLFTMRFMDVDLPARQVVVRPGEVTRVDWKGQAGAVIEGRLENFAGSAVLHLHVVDHDGTPGGIAGGAYTNEDQRFRIPGVRPGHYLLVGHSAEPGRSLSLAHEVVVGESDRLKEVILKLPDGAICGRVVVDGGPLERATVKLFRPDTPSEIADAVVVTAPDGAFSIAGVSERASSLEIAHLGQGTVYVPLAHDDVGTVTLRPEAVLDLSVIDDRQRPLAGATLQVMTTSAPKLSAHTLLADSEGHCVQRALGPYQWQVSASCDGHESSHDEAVLAAGESRALTIVLKRLGLLLVRVSSADGLAAIGAEIALTTARGQRIRGDRTLATDDQGELRIPGLAAGEYLIACESLSISSRARVSPGETTEVVLDARDR